MINSTLKILNYTTDSIKSKLTSLPKNILRLILGTVVTIAIGIVFFIVRDGVHLFGLVKDKISK